VTPRLRDGMPEAPALAASIAHCRKLARSAARNFYYGFRLLPAEKRDALCALYAFMRGVDDISDEPGDLASKTRGLAECRARMDRALADDAAELEKDLVWPAFRHFVHRFGIPVRYLHDLISGAEMDLTVARYETFERLREYCYRVAGTVGLCCVYVFGFSDPGAAGLAETLGIAFQLTNILRDIPKDYRMGRVYLPQEDMARFDCRPEDLGAPHAGPNLASLVQFEAARAWKFYEEGWSLIPLVERDSRSALWALARIYSGILEKIEMRNWDVLAAPSARLSTAEKVWVLAQARLGWDGADDVPRKRDSDRRRAGGPFLGRRAG
jgi:15-cis-phytoene synthase